MRPNFPNYRLAAAAAIAAGSFCLLAAPRGTVPVADLPEGAAPGERKEEEDYAEARDRDSVLRDP